MEDPYRMHQLI